MHYPKKIRHRGFVLIEALIALLLISMGLLAVSRLQALSLSVAGQAKSRSEAVTLSQKKLEEVRNILVKATFTGTPLLSGNATVTGSNAVYAMEWTVSTPTGGLEQRLIQFKTIWTDSQNVEQRLDLNSVVAWDDPGAQGKLTTGLGGSLISPTGSAQRGSGTYTGTGVPTVNFDGSKIAVNNGTTYLLSSTNQILLYLSPKNDVVQSFTTITGKVFFDQNAANGIPSSATVRVRLSSEGECIFNNTANQLTAVTGGSNSYKYFTYTCYVGPGWYGNVGVLVDESVNGNAANPTICLGDPSFNGGASNNTLISAHPLESATRSYRGFKGSQGDYQTTGMGTQSVVDQTASPVVNMPWSGTKYGYSYQPNGTAFTGPFDGRPRPSSYPAFYAVAAGNPTDYFEQNFLITKVSGQGTCNDKMAGGVFTRNAGKYVCINPDNDAAADVCPPIWPGFGGQVGSGSTNYVLTVTTTGAGTGTVTSSPSGITCNSTCTSSFAVGTSITLTAVATSGSTFSGWSGGNCSGIGTCTVAVNGATTITANFTSGIALTVALTGSGSGTVTSSPLGISCGATCTYGFVSGTVVQLSAAPNNGSTFTGWSGGNCSGTGNCTVTVSAATTVTATYSSASGSNYVLTVLRAGNGTGAVSSSSGISCGSICSLTLAAGASVTLTAVASNGSVFDGWSGGGCSGTAVCIVTVNEAKSVTATFTLNPTCNTTISGSASYRTSVTPSANASNVICNMDSNGSLNFSCSGSLLRNTVVTLTNQSQSNGNPVIKTRAVTWDCSNQTGINFL